jgi:predicted DCC family thiol-disulfide oxidoreductase YuxK
MQAQPLSSAVEPTAYIIYDGACPFCSLYVRHLRIRAALGSVYLVNARENHRVVCQVKAAGYDLNDAMALVIGDNIDVGPDCLWKLALMTTRSGVFNRFNAVVFSSRRLSRLIYPLLRWSRNTALHLMGRPGISQ